MSEQIFADPPQVELLQWLARGSLKQNLLRSIRLWACLQFLYGEKRISEPFSFSDWRDNFFSPTHPKGDAVPDPHDPECACAKTTANWIFDGETPVRETEWRRSLSQHDGIAKATLDNILQQRLFAITRRSLQADLQILTELGWLEKQGKEYCLVKKLPTRPLVIPQLNTDDLWFLNNPDLATIAQSFKEPIRDVQRFFFEIDYIIYQTNQDQVENWYENLKQFWNLNLVPPIRITYNSARQGKTVTRIVYPVCLYYAQRAIYLCAFGQKDKEQGEWYNYRLDRIQQMDKLEWTDEDIPQLLLKCYPDGLPNPDYIREQMAQAWGFDFYQQSQLMLLRFEKEFHDRYIQGTFRHDTFKRVSYQQAAQLIRQHTPQKDRQVLLAVLKSRSREDAYYQVSYREGDTNVGMRLRAWRPHAEVLLPWKLRQEITREVSKEDLLYQDYTVKLR